VRSPTSRGSPSCTWPSTETGRPTWSGSPSCAASPSSPRHRHEEGGETDAHQVIWLGAEATAYAVQCDQCGDDHRWSTLVDSTVVEGTLRQEADVGFTTYRRGHRIRVRRITRLRLVAAR